MQPTLQDIAKRTHTSVSTVSRVLSGGNLAQRISPATRQRVLDAARELGYRPNLVARSLRTRQSKTIALLVSDIANPWFGQIASLVEQSLHRRGYSMLLCNSGEDPDVETDYLTLLPQRGIDGLIVVPLARSRDELLEHLPASLPLVALDRAVPGVSSVASDQDQLAGQLCDTLARVGIRRVALIAGPQHVVTHQRRAEVVSERFDVVFRFDGPAQRETGRAAFIQIDTEVEAIICTNNFLGEGVIGSIETFDDPPVIGCFDEIAMMHLLPIPIVSSNQDVPVLAEACVEQMMRQLRGEAEEGSSTILPARVVTNRAFNTRFGV